MWGREAYTIWAPQDGLWSLWVKPTLFAQKRGVTDLAADTGTTPSVGAGQPAPDPNTPLGQFLASVQPEPIVARSKLRDEQLANLPKADGNTAIIAELPGVSSVELALLLARRGWRPVPLFNATYGTKAEINLGDLIQAMAKQLPSYRASTSGLTPLRCSCSTRVAGVNASPRHRAPLITAGWSSLRISHRATCCSRTVLSKSWCSSKAGSRWPTIFAMYCAAGRRWA